MILSAWVAIVLMGAAESDTPRTECIKVCLISGAEEYDSDASLAALSAYLQDQYCTKCTLIKAEGETSLPGLEALDDCDVALFFTRRLTLPDDQLARIKRYALKGKPIVAVRTASHGFQNWLEFDRLLLGGNYAGHFSNDISFRARATDAGKTHPILKGVGELASRGSLYKTSPVANDVTVLMTGSSPEGTEPAVWTREREGARIVYTSIGAKGDFENGSYRRLLANSLFWAARKSIPEPLGKIVINKNPGASGGIEPALRTDPLAKGILDLPLRNGDAKEIRKIPVSKVAIVICDMWDKHWCRGATERCDAIAARMAPLIAEARKKGVQIIHAPSDCMAFYEGTPQRARMANAPRAHLVQLKKFEKEAPLPIDDSDGGCDTGESSYLAWTRQNPRIDIGEFDGVSQDGTEIAGFLKSKGISHVIIMGVHTNMCVLNRSFAIKQMTKWGFSCVLVRDLTDTMYNPAMPPKVSHDEGTNLVVRFIEDHWCPTTTSKELLEGLPK